MEIITAIAAGIALAAACGFRVFLPLTAAALAARTGYIDPSGGFAWLSSNTALALLSVATVVEIAGYYIPWVDHALDVIASPASVVAGTVVAAAAFGDVHPAIKWTAALVAGGGAAATIQAGTVGTRAVSGATTGGLGNPIVSTLELIGSLLMSLLAVVVPILALIIAIVIVIWIARRLIRRGTRRGDEAVVPQSV